MNLHVGIIQFNVQNANRAANRETIAELFERSFTPPANGEPTAVVLPEIWDIGYALNRKEELADDEGESSASFLGELARKYNVWFTGGSVLTRRKDGTYANRAQIIDPTGKLVAFYDKVHLIRLMHEDKHFASGRSDCRFDLNGVKAGCVICYDIRFCEWLRRYALNGTEVLFVSAEWPEARADHWRVLLQAHAIENQMYIVACNRVGQSGKTTFGGGSMIIDPWGKILYEGGREEEMAFVTIDTDKVNETRSYLTVFQDRVPELYTQ